MQLPTKCEIFGGRKSQIPLR